MLMLLPIGGVPLDEETGEHPLRQRVGREIAIALSGPLLNLLLAAATAVIVAAVAPEAKLLQRPLIYSGALLRSLVWVNAGLAALNLLPAFPLDGGRITRVLLARRMEPQVATRYSVMFGQGFAMILILAGIWNTWLMLTGFFLFVAAQLEERSLVFQSVVQNVRMEEVMLTDFCTLSPADTLEDALAKAVHTLQDDFPVIRGGDLVGVISRTKIVEALRSGGNAYVQSAMSRVFEVAQRNETLAAAFKKLSHRGHTLIPVVEGERLVGIVTLQNLMHSMGLLAETRRLSK
jgi:CBS domain-containing protein